MSRGHCSAGAAAPLMDEELVEKEKMKVCWQAKRRVQGGG
jgi:hypothetical protein